MSTKKPTPKKPARLRPVPEGKPIKERKIKNPLKKIYGF